MPVPLHRDELAFLRAQVANARAHLEAVGLDALPDGVAEAIEAALRVLHASSGVARAPSEDPGERAHQAARAHLDACNEALYRQEVEGDDDVSSPAFGPYCGREDCMVREVLAAAWPALEADAALNARSGETSGRR